MRGKRWPETRGQGGQSRDYDLEHRNLSKVPEALLLSVSIAFLLCVCVPGRPEVKNRKGTSPCGI